MNKIKEQKQMSKGFGKIPLLHHILNGNTSFTLVTMFYLLTLNSLAIFIVSIFSNTILVLPILLSMHVAIKHTITCG